MAEAAQLVELYVGDVQWEEKQGGRKKGVERRDSGGGGGGQRGRTQQAKQGHTRCSRVVVAIPCGRKRKRFPVKWIIFIVSPQNVCSVLYIAGEEQLSELLLCCCCCYRSTVVDVTVER